MYPVLNNCRVRGVDGDFFLHQFKKGEEFSLEKLHAEILWHCNGEYSLPWISKKFSQPKKDLLFFFNVLKEKDLLTFNKKKNKINFPQLTKAPYLQEIQIEVTGQCNLWCKHCYARKEFQKATEKELSTKEMYEFFDQMTNLNISKCFFSGGESFLRKDLPDLINYLSKKCIGITGIFTNGTIYRQDIIDALIKNQLKTTFLVSLDGYKPEIHDFIRGNGNFKKTISFIKKVIGQGFRVTVNTVAMKQNVKDLMAMRSFLENLGVSRWRISIPREQGETIVNKKLILPPWQDIFIAYEELLHHSLSSPGKMKIQLSSIFKTEFLKTKTYYLYQESNSCCEYKKSSLVLASNGNLIPCPASIDIPLGNIREKRLEEIWYSDLTQSFKTLPISKTDCRNCKIKDYCGAGCRIIAWKIHKNILAKDENACPLYHFFYKVAMPIMEKYGIHSKTLEKSSPYKFNANIINELLLKNLREKEFKKL